LGVRTAVHTAPGVRDESDGDVGCNRTQRVVAAPFDLACRAPAAGPPHVSRAEFRGFKGVAELARRGLAVEIASSDWWLRVVLPVQNHAPPDVHHRCGRRVECAEHRLC